MADKTFHIQSLEEAQKFSIFLDKYYARRCGNGSTGIIPDQYISTFYSYCQTHCANGQLFNAVVDLELTYLFMKRDCDSSAGIWNQWFSPDKPQVETVLKDLNKFSGKMDILYHFTSFSLRCRAFWDKYMGTLILLYDAKNYDRYFKARSRKNAFIKIAQQWDVFSPHIQKCLAKVLHDQRIHAGLRDKTTELLKDYSIPFPYPFLSTMPALIEALDNIRTAEAHGTGMLRKWSLAMFPLDKSRDFGLINHWNIANSFMHSLRRTILDR